MNLVIRILKFSMRATEELHELHELQDCVTKIFP